MPNSQWGTHWGCVAHNEAPNGRAELTMERPMGGRGQPLGFSIGEDDSQWDTPRARRSGPQSSSMARARWDTVPQTTTTDPIQQPTAAEHCRMQLQRQHTGRCTRRAVAAKTSTLGAEGYIRQMRLERLGPQALVMRCLRWERWSPSLYGTAVTEESVRVSGRCPTPLAQAPYSPTL